MEINQLLESSNSYKSMQADSARLADKWGKSGLLEGIDSEKEKGNMAMILENQAKQIVAEANTTVQVVRLLQVMVSNGLVLHFL